MPGQRGRLVADRPPAGRRREAITQVRWSTSDLPKRAASMPLGQRHADRGGDALAERAGGGLDARMLAEFRVAGGRRVQLAEAAAAPRCPCRHGRSGAAAHRAASSHGRPTARSGRGRASADRRRRTSGSCVNSTVATSAMPIGMPGWPDFASSTASMASARMASAMRRASLAGRARIAACAARAGFWAASGVGAMLAKWLTCGCVGGRAAIEAGGPAGNRAGRGAIAARALAALAPGSSRTTPAASSARQIAAALAPAARGARPRSRAPAGADARRRLASVGLGPVQQRPRGAALRQR